MKQKIKKGDHLHIFANETLYRSTDLVVGEDINLEEAEYFIDLIGESSEFNTDDNGYDELQSIIEDIKNVYDSDGYTNVNYEIIEDADR
jgi:hypothetical protein